MSDPVNRPSHYTYGGIEVLDVIEDWGLNYHLGNAVKYLARAGRKNIDRAAEDIRKCAFYLRRWQARRNQDAISPPWVSNCKHALDAVVDAWSLDPARSTILGAIWHCDNLDLVCAQADQIATAIESQGAEAVLWLK